MTHLRRPRVSALFPEQYAEAATVLGRAFVDDPVTRAILPQLEEPTERARRLGAMFWAALEIEKRNGLPVFGALEKGRVVAVAVTEGTAQLGAAGAILGGLRSLPRAVAAVGWGGVVRGVRLQQELNRNRPQQGHLYLNLLGVAPEFQGRHYGIAILDHLRDIVSDRRDMEAGVYLETATEANVAYYTRAGYRLLGEIFPMGVRMWRMLQPPMR